MTKKLAKIYLQFFGNLISYFVSIELSRSNLSLQWKAEQKQRFSKVFFRYVGGETVELSQVLSKVICIAPIHLNLRCAQLLSKVP